MAQTVNWGGSEFTVYDPETTWNEVAGLYVFAFLGSDQQGSLRWRAVYMGQTTNFSTRLPNHEKWPEAERMGATHIHALVVPQEATRLRVEAALIETYSPPLNVKS